MNFTDEQKSAVVDWLGQGRSLSDIQQALKVDFNLTITYMELRFMVDDLEIPLSEDTSEDVADAGEDLADAGEDAADAVLEPEPVLDPSGVQIDVDALVLPGALVSGSVTFSDGESLKWQLAATGQLGLIPGDNPDYRPSPEDVQSFQEQLEEVLRSKGY
tara:strand:- start:312 stop:791 length:480 start_codon:yes stop_codon:yes gene_type:complete